MQPPGAELRLHCWRFGVRRGHLILGMPPSQAPWRSGDSMRWTFKVTPLREDIFFRSKIRKRRYRDSGPSFRGDSCSRCSPGYDDLRAFNHIACMTKISDGRELVPRPLQQNEIRRRSRWIARIAHEERRASVNQPRDKMPVVDISVVVKVP